MVSVVYSTWNPARRSACSQSRSLPASASAPSVGSPSSYQVTAARGVAAPVTGTARNPVPAPSPLWRVAASGSPAPALGARSRCRPVRRRVHSRARPGILQWQYTGAELMQPRSSPARLGSQGQLDRRYRSRAPFILGLSAGVLFLLLGIAMAVPTSSSDIRHVRARNRGSADSRRGLDPGPSTHQRSLADTCGHREAAVLPANDHSMGAVESFTVARIPRNQAWRTVLVELRPQGSAYLTSVAGSERYVRRAIAEFEEYRSQTS